MASFRSPAKLDKPRAVRWLSNYLLGTALYVRSPIFSQQAIQPKWRDECGALQATDAQNVNHSQIQPPNFATFPCMTVPLLTSPLPAP